MEVVELVMVVVEVVDRLASAGFLIFTPAGVQEVLHSRFVLLV